MTPRPPGLLDAGSGDRFVIACLTYAALVVLALGHQVSGQGVLQSPVVVLDALDAKVDLERGALVPGLEWERAACAPDVHRPALRLLLLGALRLVGDGTPERLYGVYVTLQAVSLLAAAGAFDALLLALRFSGRQALLGGSLLLAGYPVLFGNDLPLHAREDPLALAVVALTLLAIARDRLRAVAVLALVGATVREACVAAALPALLLSSRPPRERALALAPALAALAIVRAAAGPAAPVPDAQPWLAPVLPLEALLHAGLALGWVWSAAAARLVDPTPPRHPLLGRRPVLLALAGTVAAALATGFDARALTTLAPLALPLALDLAAAGRLRALLAAPAALATLVALALAGAGGLAWLARHPERLDAVQGLLGEGWNPGAVPRVVVEDDDGGQVEVDPALASPLQGPFTVAHGALGGALLAGLAARGRRWAPLRRRGSREARP